MLFFDFQDRKAGAAALFSLMEYMRAKHPTEVRKGMLTETLADCENQWDNMNQIEREAFVGMWQSCGLSPGSYYEAHITIKPWNGPHNWDRVCADIEKLGAECGFYFSKIDGDEQTGNGIRWYLTRSIKDGDTLFTNLMNMCAGLDRAGIPYVRRKIEHIVFDERSVPPASNADQIAGTARAA